MTHDPRPIPPILRFLLAAGLLFFAHLENAAGRSLHGPEIDPASGIEMEFESVSSELPMRGFASIRATITNNSGRARTWRIASTSTVGWNEEGRMTRNFSLTVPDGDTQRFDLLVPLMPTQHSYGELTLRVSGFGITSLSPVSFSGSTGSSSSTLPNVAMVGQLARNWGDLQAERSDLAGGHLGSSTFMPADWRGYSGFDQVWMRDKDWSDLGTAGRLALLDWVAVGGTLYLCREENDATPLPGLDGLARGEPLTRGFGTIGVWERSGDDLNIAETASEVSRHGPPLHLRLDNEYRRHTWPLLASIDDVKLRKGLFIAFLVAFAVVIGPVNLFVFARGSRRYRLFWTTPALSLGASAAIFLLILLQDGVGGTGKQLAVWTHLPEENRTAFLQEQVSRTALLTGRSFSIDAAAAISPIEIGSLASVATGDFEAGENAFGGDWFRNRSVQGQLIQGVTATRWRLEATRPAAGEAPKLLSTFPFTFRSVFYQSPGGQWWRATNLPPGTAQALEKVDQAVFDQARDEFLADAGPVIEERVSDLPIQPGHFYAFTDDEAGVWRTLESIDWQTHASFHTGPVIFP